MTTIIHGLKIPYKHLWERIGFKETHSCNCPESSAEYNYCPFCGIQKSMRKVKLYKSVLTGEETIYRNLHTEIKHLDTFGISVYDSNPRGFTDDPVYIYVNYYPCYFELKNNPINLLNLINDDTETVLCYMIGKTLFEKGKFGLWVFEKPSIEPINTETEQKKSILADSNSGATALFIPLNGFHGSS
jgi:hypothetical protein